MPAYSEFEVSLVAIEPRIWRRFQLAETATFDHLHRAIQTAFGWESCHLWEFREPGRRGRVLAGAEQDVLFLDSEETPDARQVKLAQYFTPDLSPANCQYIYDFGDTWIHAVTLSTKGIRTASGGEYMALIEHLERDGWEEFFRSTFRFTLEVMKHDRFRSVGSSADDLRSWLGRDGIARVRERLNEQMEMRRFSPSRAAAVNECLDRLVQENRLALLDLVADGVIPASGQARIDACDVSETDVRDLLGRMMAGERPFEDWMHAHGRSDEEIREVYKAVDEWLMQKGIISQRPSAPGLN